MSRFADIRLARMSSGKRCLIRDLGLVKGGEQDPNASHEPEAVKPWRTHEAPDLMIDQAIGLIGKRTNSSGVSHVANRPHSNASNTING